VNPTLKTLITLVIGVAVSLAAQYGFNVCPAADCKVCTEAAK
jgi:hypothetical protein